MFKPNDCDIILSNYNYYNNDNIKKIINTKQFKIWFNNSKVIDTNNNPLLVCHSSDNDFKNFNRKKLGLNTIDNANSIGYASTAYIGYWFNDEFIWGDFAKYCFLKIENPYYFQDNNDLADELTYIGAQIGFDIEEINVSSSFTANQCKKIANKFVNNIKYDGYDGIIINRDIEYKNKSYVVFNNNQIKCINKML